MMDLRLRRNYRLLVLLALFSTALVLGLGDRSLIAYAG